MSVLSQPLSGRESGPPFKLEVDARRKLIVATMSGYWDMPTFSAFAAELRKALRRMKITGGCDYYLADASGFAVQSAEIALALQALVDSLEPDCPRRMAGIVGGQLNKMQARRAGATPNRQAFASEAEARAWLFSGAPPGRALPR